MIVVDGLDELQEIYDNSKETCPTTELIKEVIDTKSSLLIGHKTIACDLDLRLVNLSNQHYIHRRLN